MTRLRDPITQLLHKVVQVELDSRLIRKVQYRRRGDADGDGKSIADLFLCYAHLTGFLQMAFQAALTFGDNRAADGDQLLRLQVERARSEITLFVELQVDVAKTGLDHAHRRRSLLRGLKVILCHTRLHLLELDAIDANFGSARKSRANRHLTIGIYRPAAA